MRGKGTLTDLEIFDTPTHHALEQQLKEYYKHNAWCKKLPQTKKGNSYLNFIASHDGIGMRPIEGIINNRLIKKLLLRLKKKWIKIFL